MNEPTVPLEFESEYVVGAYGTAYRAIEVFRTGELQGTHNERLRIIKLIEQQTYDSTIKGLSWIPDGSELSQADLIALIKGELK